MKTPRWVVYRKQEKDSELLQVVEIYAEGEKKELVKKENRKWSHKRELLLLERGERCERVSVST